MAGWYFRKPFEVADRSCYQRVRLIGGRPVCSDAHVFWSGHYSLWKLGALTDDKAGMAICQGQHKDVQKLTEHWKLYEPPQS
mmetsp:Transcript_51353/g.123126  ORF Transcript_51353/g.123126 Transcript_51353/m.123126 type:complete len:82 (-) Transcript_51353:59-304(-)